LWAGGSLSDNAVVWEADMFNLDLNGFLFSTEFLTQFAALISGLISALLGQFLTGLFTPTV